MSNYPEWWDFPITVYNKYTDKTTRIVTWHKTVIPNCFWKNTGNKVNIGDVILDTESVTCRIPYQDNFLEAGEWINIPNDQMSQYFTLKQADILVKGAVDDEIDEYKSGMRSTDLLNKYHALQSCMEIKEVTINTMKGMLTPHYYVRGI